MCPLVQKLEKKCRLIPAVCFVEKAGSEFPRMVIFCTRGHIGMFCANYLLGRFLHKGTTLFWGVWELFYTDPKGERSELDGFKFLHNYVGNGTG